jgi:Uma2 family endonuclease
MSTLAPPSFRPPIVYPDSDGLPMAENTLQYQWIVTIVTGLRHLFADDPNVFVAGDLFWYPVEGHPEIRLAPDAMAAFGRPAGDRSSYRQWEEAGVAPQVIFEVLSPGNRSGEMREKFDFYSRYGAEEYYVYDPDRLVLTGYRREQDRLVEIEQMDGHVSPRLGIKFELDKRGLTLIRPDGEPFLTAEEYARREEQERRRADEAEDRSRQAEDRAEQERDRAIRAEDRANKEQDRAKQAEERAERLELELDRIRQQSAQPPGPRET